MSSDKKNSSWLAAQYIINLITSLVMLKLNIINYGEEVFGIWILLSSVWGFGSVIDFGFGIGIIKFVAQYKEDKSKLEKILSSVFYLFLLLGGLIFLLCNLIVYNFYFNNILLVPTKHLKIFKIVFLILGVSFLFKYLLTFFKSILDGLNKFSVTSSLLILQYFVLLTGVIVIYIFKFDIVFLAILYLLTHILIFSIYVVYFYTKIKINLKWKEFDIVEVKKLFGFTFSVQLMNLFNTLIDPVVKFMIGNYYSINTIPAYEIARRFAIAISGLYFNTFRIILPKASALTLKEDINLFINDNILRYVKIGVTYSGLMFGILLFPIVLFIENIFGIKEAILIFMILALPEAINNFGYSIYNFLLGIGKSQILVLIQINNLVFAIVGLFIGFKLFNNSLGLLGYFFSVVIGNISMVFFLKKNWDISLLNLFNQTKLYKLFLLILFLCATIFLFNYNIFDNTYILLITSIVCLGLFLNDLKYFYNQFIYNK